MPAALLDFDFLLLPTLKYSDYVAVESCIQVLIFSAASALENLLTSLFYLFPYAARILCPFFNWPKKS